MHAGCFLLQAAAAGVPAPCSQCQPGESLWSLDCRLCCLALLTECPGRKSGLSLHVYPCSLELFAHVFSGLTLVFSSNIVVKWENQRDTAFLL